MSKGKPKVKFHYGQEDIKKLMKRIVKYKLQESNIKKHTIATYYEKVQR
ncbi:hypothetical protein [Clostridium ganghwense]|uniref:Integrase n=1 Tax=Clostridium ganghwense TaxID=312089 RepID=A0ABT4CLM6_9CLOT|nr:hypothetical protein [Clostridium ganghwense]MCY6369950.1 hypothetical protein [Clostridium ganghwense]